jgi:PAS domain S-box-containing protein
MHHLIHHLRQQRFALILAGVAFVGTAITWPISQRFPFALFIAAVMVSAWLGGLRPGLVTTGASALALLLLFVFFPDARGGEASEHFVLRLIMFLLIGVLAGYLSMKCKAAVIAHDRFHDGIASMGESLIFTDARGRITFLNATAQTLTGLAPADAEGKVFGEVVTLLQEDSREPLEDPAAWTLHANTPAALPDGTLVRSVSNMETPIEGTAIPLHDADERVIGVAIAFHSAAGRRAKEQELRQREQRFRNALGSAPAPLLLLDAQGHCLFTNRACQSLGGFTFDEGLGQGWTRCIHLDDRDRLLTDWSASFHGGKGVFQGEFRLNTNLDEPLRLRLRASTIFSDMGQTLGQVATIEDLTDFIRSETARRESEDRAERAEAARRSSEEQAATAAQRQKKIEESLGQLREELQMQLLTGAEEKHSVTEKLTAAESAKTEVERARDELARRLEDSDKARRQAEETLHGSQLEFARLMDEHLTSQRTAEETLQQTCDEFARQIAAARRETEDALSSQHGQIDPSEFERHASARREAESALQAAKSSHAQEMDRLTNDTLAEMAALEEKLAQARQTEQAALAEKAELRGELDALQAKTGETKQQLAKALQRIEELTAGFDLSADEVGLLAVSPLPPAPVKTNGHPELTAGSSAAAHVSLDAGDWLSFN